MAFLVFGVPNFFPHPTILGHLAIVLVFGLALFLSLFLLSFRAPLVATDATKARRARWRDVFILIGISTFLGLFLLLSAA
jgi:hypothetical protein